MKSVVRFITLTVLILNANLLMSREISGYIIDNSSDTIIGEIEVSAYDIYTGWTVIKGINMEPFHSTVYFRKKGEKRFKSFTPHDITGYGFTYKSVDYKYSTFRIEKKSIILSKKERLRFLNLVFQGEISVYKDIDRKDFFVTKIDFDDRVIDYCDYYLYNKKHGLKWAILNKEFKSITELLSFYEIDQKFISQLPANVKFKDIVEILYKYEMWKKLNNGS